MKDERMCVGVEEGDTCNRDECMGTMEYPHPEDCSCHLIAPCGACTEIRLTCSSCGAQPDDEV